MASGFDAKNVPDIGQTAVVPNDYRARLMYYLKCVNSVLELDIPKMEYFTNYNNYLFLTPEKCDILFQLLMIFTPEFLIDKVFFASDELCGNANNKFFELAVAGVGLSFSVPRSIVIGGKSTKVKKWMAYKRRWILEYYVNPMLEFHESRLSVKRINMRVDIEVLDVLGRRPPPPDVVLCCNIL